MIAVSSHKPFAQSAETASNQARAFNSWTPVFDWIYYFGLPEPQLRSNKTVFIPSGIPSIQLLMQMASVLQSPVCIINADIVLDSKARAILQSAMRRFQVASSFRLEFTSNIREARRVDNGLDMFIAHPAVWRNCWPVVSPEFRIGRPVWDSWLNAWLRDEYRMAYTDLSAHRLLFHPRHSRGQTARAIPVA